jgi:hypothetical protein
MIYRTITANDWHLVERYHMVSNYERLDLLVTSRTSGHDLKDMSVSGDHSRMIQDNAASGMLIGHGMIFSFSEILNTILWAP